MDFELDLDAINATAEAPSVVDIAKGEKEDDKLFGATVRRFEETTDLRSLLAKTFTIIIAFWLLSVILILTGNCNKYHLSDEVLKTLLTTTTIQVLGMMIIILWDLFPGGKDKKNPSENKN